jgi:lipoprotein-releasing system permease protein
VHLITRISVVGIAITTAALVLLIAAFNGIEGMVERLYSIYDAPVTVRSAKGKTFDESLVDLRKIRNIEGVAEVSRAVEEIVILKHQKKWANARMIGIDSNFLLTADIEHHIVDGYPSLETNGSPNGIIGATLLDKLDGYISGTDGYEEVLLYTPLREGGISFRKNPFKQAKLLISARMNYNREVNMQELLVPLGYAREQLNYDTDISALYIGVKPGYEPSEVRDRVRSLLGSGFTVKTAAEKNELIFKTSQSEKRIVIIILVFVFILAAFNLIASLTMLYIEKKDNIVTMQHFGADRQFVFRIFFLEGLLIAARGIVIGIVLGTGICLLQIYGKIIVMPNSAGEAFPIDFSVGDGVLIVALVSILSALASWLPVRYLVRRS